MHCRLVAEFVLMLSVFSLLVFVVTQVRKFPNEVYVSVVKV